MSSKRHVRRKRCEGKKRYGSMRAAQEAAEGTAATFQLTWRMNAYGCSFCGHFHVGHVRGQDTAHKERREWIAA